MELAALRALAHAYGRYQAAIDAEIAGNPTAEAAIEQANDDMERAYAVWQRVRPKGDAE